MTTSRNSTTDSADGTDGNKKSAASALSAVNSPVPAGRKKLVQGNALGIPPPQTVSPEGAKHLPAGWSLVRLGDIAKNTSGGTPRRDRPQFFGGTIPWVKSGELGYTPGHLRGDCKTLRGEPEMILYSPFLLLPLPVHQLFGEQLPSLLDELNEVLAA